MRCSSPCNFQLRVMWGLPQRSVHSNISEPDEVQPPPPSHAASLTSDVPH